jgi:hypothetical protein
MDILQKAKKLEAGLARVLDGAARNALKSGALDPLEIVHAVVERVVAEVQPAGRGKHVFPFNRIKVSVVAPDREARARLAVVFGSEPSLHTRIAGELRAAGCEPPDLAVKTVYTSTAEADWRNPQWRVEFARVSTAAPIDTEPVAAAVPPTIELIIVKGTGIPSSSTFAQARIELGRCAEVRDGRNCLIRMNHVAFSDDAGQINDTVSRRHAHIEFNPSLAQYVVHDDRSAHGTSVLRDGRAVAVPSGSRGIRLRSGDEIVLGEARVQVRIAGQPAS